MRFALGLQLLYGYFLKDASPQLCRQTLTWTASA
jgi:hypothetical protein